MDETEFQKIDHAFRESPLFVELLRIFEEEDPDYFESHAKRQHFIPRLVLNRFAQENDAKHFFYHLDVRTGAPRRVQTAEAASRRYLYAFTGEDGKRNNKTEGFLAIIEQHAAQALDRLLEAPETFTDGDRATLSFFIALLDHRTPASIKRMAGITDAGMRMMFANGFSNPGRFREMYTHVIGEATDEEIEEFRQEMLRMLEAGEISFADEKAYAIRQGFSAAGGTAYIVYGMSWMLLRSEATCFVTSDRGLAMCDPKPQYPWSGVAWMSSPYVEVTIPLSSGACLVLYHGERHLVDGEATPEEVGRINLRTYGWASDYIYGETQEIVGCVRRLAKRRPQDIIRPKLPTYTLLLEVDPEDDSFARANVRTGRPPYVISEGVPHDYVVIGPDDNATAEARHVHDVVEARARKTAGLSEGAKMSGRAVIDPVHID